MSAKNTKVRKISDQHQYYQAMAFRWRRVRDFFDGRDSLLAHDLELWTKNRRAPGAREEPLALLARGAYVPPLSEKQLYGDYYAYLNRGEYDNWVELSVNGFRGLIVGKGVGLDGIPEFMITDSDLEGTPLEEKIEDVITEVLTVNRAGWLVDRPADVEGLSQLEAEQQGVRPYIVAFKTEDIIWWRKARVGNVVKVVEVVLREPCEDDEGKPDYRYRQLVLEPMTLEDETALVGYASYMWSRKSSHDEYMKSAPSIPLLAGKPLEEIPFYFFDAHGGKADPQNPTIESLVLLALAHWQSSVDMRHGAFCVALPTPCFHGYPEDFEPVLGGLNTCISSNPDATENFLELSGQGLEPLRNIIKDIEARIAKFGGRMLADEKKDAESTETVRLRSSGEVATLADIARAVSRIAGQALTFANQWTALGTTAVVTLQTDYAAVSIDSAMLTALDGALTANHITQTDYNAYIRKTGIIESNRDDAAIEADLERERAASDAAAGDALVQTATRLAARGGAA